MQKECSTLRCSFRPLQCPFGFFRIPFGGWRDGSVVKSTVCSSRGPEFNSQQPRGGSQPSVMGSDALFWCV
ncbi:rCG63685 [Rattus norvegicus]|uniref:RCG63685 n=1 Tax=Rattus norvegicus TaxID=10116 RepID=A6HRK3_RAT|nr:rCG63685 [Rattus norvegicus]